MTTLYDLFFALTDKKTFEEFQVVWKSVSVSDKNTFISFMKANRIGFFSCDKNPYYYNMKHFKYKIANIKLEYPGYDYRNEIAELYVCQDYNDLFALCRPSISQKYKNIF